MSVGLVEWVLVVYYGKSAHRATYGRLDGTKYTKDYIQLSKREQFITDLTRAYPALSGSMGSVAITYKWPGGSSQGTLFVRSADRPHLAWEFDSAPLPWRMSDSPSESTAETIRGDPSMESESGAEREFDRLLASDFGQPYLVATKLKGDANSLHLRVLVSNPPDRYKWASLSDAPAPIQMLASSTSRNSALAWKYFEAASGSEALYFDPHSKGDPWRMGAGGGTLATSQRNVPPAVLNNDLLAEHADTSPEEISKYQAQLRSDNYEVSDAFATTKTRGSAQRVFANRVKSNYGWRCAVTGIKTRKFLVASHIVPWSVDETIRLDPSNGICLSVLVDRAFEYGYLSIQDDLTVVIDHNKLSPDRELKKQLIKYDGQRLAVPSLDPPKIQHLRRRRGL